MSRNRIHTLALSFAVIAILSMLSIVAQAQQAQLMGSGIGDVKLGLGKQPSGEILSVYPDKDGKIDLGRLAEGTYTLTFSYVVLPPPPATCQTCKSFYDTRSNSAKATAVIEGAKSGPIVVVIDFERNQMFNATTMSFGTLQTITFQVSGYDVLTGRVTRIPPPTPTQIPTVN